MSITREYRAAERQALAAFAISVLSNPDADDDDRKSAHERLLEGDAADTDMGRLTLDEVRTLVTALRTARPLLDKARGLTRDERPAPAPRTPLPEMRAEPDPIESSNLLE